jgi:hypothetical protein
LKWVSGKNPRAQAIELIVASRSGLARFLVPVVPEFFDPLSIVLCPDNELTLPHGRSTSESCPHASSKRITPLQSLHPQEKITHIPAIIDYNMRKQRRGSPSNHRLGAFLHKIQLAFDTSASSPQSSSSSRISSSTTLSNGYEDGPPDEGFHEEWPPFGPRDLMAFMSNKESTGT